MKIFVFCALFLLSCGMSYLFFYERNMRKFYYEKICRLENQLNEHKTAVKVYKLRDNRRICITKTLMIAYNLSNWEAYCYSIFFDNFSIYYKIDWEIYAAVMRIESNFNPTIKSNADCKGLMQVKESTGKEMAKNLNISFIENQSLWNEFINIIIGTDYLSKLIKEKGLDNGIKSYLGGPDYLKSIQKKSNAYIYIREYKTKVSDEYNKLRYIYRGIVDEHGMTNFLELKQSTYIDTSALIFSILNKLK